MANILAAQGLIPANLKAGASPTYQAQACKIQNSYGTSIPVGSVVLSAGGYITLAGDNPSTIFGVFMGVLPYFDTNLQQTAHGRNGAYVASTSASKDIDCLVITDPMQVYRLQFSGIAPAVTWPGLNANWIAGTNATLSTSGISVLAGDSGSLATTNTLPFVVEGLAGVPGGPSDPTQTNPTLLVRINPGLIRALLPTGA